MIYDPLLAQRVFTLVGNKTGVPVGKLSLETRLLHDLGVAGDDAQELLLAFQDEFGVDMSAFPFSEYFVNEPTLLNLLWFLPSQRKEHIDKKIPIALRDLVEAAASKNWKKRRET